VSQSFIQWTRISTFGFAFVMAALLGLAPVPTEFLAHANLPPRAIDYLEWLIIAIAALPGAAFWFNILKLVQKQVTPQPTAAPPAPAPAPALAASSPSPAPAPSPAAPGAR
jgi:hypothetical protein